MSDFYAVLNGFYFRFSTAARRDLWCNKCGGSAVEPTMSIELRATWVF